MISFQISIISIVVFGRLSSAQVKPAAYYYPWHSDGFHNDQEYLREFIFHSPKLGEYDDRNSETIERHISWSQRSNIQVWMTSWWGPDSREDLTLRSTILPTIENTSSTLEFAIFYETINRIGGKDASNTDKVIDDINHICDNFLDHPNYYYINERPVLVIYLTRYLEQNLLTEFILLMRTAGAKRGYNFFLIGDHAFGVPPTSRLSAFDYLDAVTNYDVYGSLGSLYAGSEALKFFYERQLEWKNAAQKQNCAFVPGVTPGFNDRGVRLDANREPLSRKLTKDSNFGSLFEASLEYANNLADSNADNLLIVTSFNEWHEDTQIEPVIGNTTADPYLYTQGLEYEGYGTRYLDILNKMTSSGPHSTKSPIMKASQMPSLTLYPTAFPTSRSSVYHSDSPSSKTDPNGPNTCDDSSTLKFPTDDAGDQLCVWLAARPTEQQKYCKQGHIAYGICEETCGKCSDSCEDTLGYFYYKGIQRNCLWLSLRRNIIDEVCFEGFEVYDTVCPETCNKCDR